MVFAKFLTLKSTTRKIFQTRSPPPAAVLYLLRKGYANGGSLVLSFFIRGFPPNKTTPNKKTDKTEDPKWVRSGEIWCG
ncbi:hypothetical protein [Chamaesiphon sp.]|uniref:hypothetical protein n=1 Tax=Chamaesiphon sp. TaxID=2814140 RepID=UPI003594067F